MTVTSETTQIPVRLDFDAFAAGFARAMASKSSRTGICVVSLVTVMSSTLRG